MLGDERVAGEPGVSGCIGNDGQAGTERRLGAERDLDRRLAQAEPHLGLEPLPPVLDEADGRDRRAADVGRQMRDVVEVRLGWGVEDGVGPQGGQPLFLVP